MLMSFQRLTAGTTSPSETKLEPAVEWRWQQSREYMV